MRKNIFTRDLPPGTQVMVIDEKYIKSPKPNTEPKYIGKYIVVKREVNGPYVLKDMHGNIYHRKVPIDQLKVLFRSGMAPALENDEDVWVVDKLLKHKKEGQTLTYEVKWKGFKETTWEPENHIHDQNLIDRYWRSRHGIKASRGTKAANIRVLTLMSDRHDIIFNEADQTAQTQNVRMIKKMKAERCAEVEKH
jgi:hypothetical protein